jgi:hypothetical protein
MPVIRRALQASWWLGLSLAVEGCSLDFAALQRDVQDASAEDAALDAASAQDTGIPSDAVLDAGSLDVGSLDVGSLDVGSLDVGPLDTGLGDPDAGIEVAPAVTVGLSSVPRVSSGAALGSSVLLVGRAERASRANDALLLAVGDTVSTWAAWIGGSAEDRLLGASASGAGAVAVGSTRSFGATADGLVVRVESVGVASVERVDGSLDEALNAVVADGTRAVAVGWQEGTRANGLVIAIPEALRDPATATVVDLGAPSRFHAVATDGSTVFALGDLDTTSAVIVALASDLRAVRWAWRIRDVRLHALRVAGAGVVAEGFVGGRFLRVEANAAGVTTVERTFGEMGATTDVRLDAEGVEWIAGRRSDGRTMVGRWEVDRHRWALTERIASEGMNPLGRNELRATVVSGPTGVFVVGHDPGSPPMPRAFVVPMSPAVTSACESRSSVDVSLVSSRVETSALTATLIPAALDRFLVPLPSAVQMETPLRMDACP